MTDTTQDNQLIENGNGSAVPVATVSATWQVRDPKGESREMIRALMDQYADRFYPGEIRSVSDLLRWLIRNGSACIEHLRPEPVS